MDAEQLETFRLFAREGSLSRAAAALHLSEPAVWGRIRALERELGVRLYQRSGRAVRLTPSGAVWLEYAERALEALEEGRRRVQRMERAHLGRLALACVPSLSYHLFPELIARSSDAFPHLELSVRTGHSDEAAQWLLERRVDVAIVTNPVRHPSLEEARLCRDEWVGVMHPDHPLARFVPLPPEAIAEQPYIAYDRRVCGWVLHAAPARGRPGRPPQTLMEFDHVETVKRLLASQPGIAIAYLPHSLVYADLATGGLIECVPRSGDHRLVVVQHRRSRSGASAEGLAVARAVRGWVEEWCRRVGMPPVAG